MEKASPDVRDAAVVIPSFAPGGSFAARTTWPRTDVIVETAITAGRGARLAHLQRGAWIMASVDVLRDAAGSAAGTDTRRARALPDGGIEARMEARWTDGLQVRRGMQVKSNGDWTSEFSAALADGSRVSGRAAKAGREGPVRFDRRKTGPDGVERWSIEGHPQQHPTGSGVVTSTTASARYQSGATAKYRQVVREVDKVLVKRREISRQTA